MMKSLRFFIMALLCAVFCNAKAADVTTTFTAADVNENNNELISFVAQKNNGSTNPTYSSNNEDYRIYAKGSLTISAKKTTIKNIKEVVINLSAQGKKRLAPISCDNGNIATQALGDETVTWTGETTEFTLTVGDNANYGSDGESKAGQLCFTSIDVTYEEDSSIPFVNTPTFTPAECTFDKAFDVTISCDEGATIYYTIDGNDPTSSSDKYIDPIPVSTTTTIKAIAIKDGIESSVATATYTFSKSISYVLVDNISQLSNNDIILIVNNEAQKAMGTQNTNNRAAVDVIINNNTIKVFESNEDIQRITLESSGNNFYFNVGDGYLYAASSDNNYLKTKTDADNNAEAEIEIAENGNATVTFQGTNTRNLLRYNSGSKLFSCYSSGQQFIQIYKEVKESEPFELTIADKATDGSKYYATMSMLGYGNYVVPAGLEVNTITIDNTKVKKTTTFSEGNVFPGNDAYYVVADNSGTFTFETTTESVTKELGDNWLYPAIAGQEITAPNGKAEDYLFYKLTFKNGENIGFYWGAEDGAPFTFTSDHKAYLAVPADDSSAGLSSIAIDDYTGINNIQPTAEQNDEVYTLSGVRVKGNLPKGVYIVNGKKQIMK